MDEIAATRRFDLYLGGAPSVDQPQVMERLNCNPGKTQSVIYVMKSFARFVYRRQADPFKRARRDFNDD